MAISATCHGGTIHMQPKIHHREIHNAWTADKNILNLCSSLRLFPHFLHLQTLKTATNKHKAVIRKVCC